MKSGHKVCIGFAHGHDMDPELGVALFELGRQRGSRIDSVVAVGGLGLLARTRNVIVTKFLDDTTADWLLMIDTDERLNVDAFDKLVATAHHTERPIVSGLVFAAYWNTAGDLRPLPVIFRMDAERGLQPIDDFPEDSVIPIDAAGTGCLMVHRSVFEAMRANANENQGPEWCFFFDGAIGGRWISEDILFSKRVADLGFPMHAHTGAVLPHRKDFWLDARHHRGFMAAASTNRDGVA